jgi:serine/threonine-protein kinase
MHVLPLPAQPPFSDRYTIYGQIGAGGMATVQYAHLIGPGGFSRPVAIKRLHPHLANDSAFASAFLDEARLSARIAHANVVATLDVLSMPDEISVVMEYVHGESLAGLLTLAASRGSRLPPKIAVTLLIGVLHGLHAAHETRGEHGEPLGIVHRDVSPENILVGSDGVARLLDFGIAKAKGRSRTTPTGELKGKLGYMAPEQYLGGGVDRRVDVYGASVVLWEALTGRVLFEGPNDGAVVNAVMHAPVTPPGELVPGLPNALDELVMRGLSRDRNERFETAREMALALEREVGASTQSEVSDWLNGLAGELLQSRAAALWQLRQRAEGRSEARADQGTRKLEMDFAADAPTRTVASDADVADVVGGRTSESGWRARPDTHKRRWVLLFVLVAVMIGGVAWMGAATHEQPATRPSREQAQSTRGAEAPAAPSVATPSAETTPSTDTALQPAHEAPELAPASAGETPTSERALDGRESAREPHDDARSGRTRRTVGKAKREAAARSQTKPQGKAERKNADCSQPYIVDALGIRRWKRECL